jgi:hypothetical protein
MAVCTACLAPPRSSSSNLPRAKPLTDSPDAGLLAKVQAAGSLPESRRSVPTACDANLKPLAFSACSMLHSSMVQIAVLTEGLLRALPSRELRSDG